jgi:hypothetical protein
MSDDATFFELNPERNYRIRIATQAEAEEAESGCNSSPNDGASFWWAAVRCVKPNFVRRVFFDASPRAWGIEPLECECREAYEFVSAQLNKQQTPSRGAVI